MMKAESFTVILILAVFLSFVPHRVSISQRNVHLDTAKKPVVSQETINKELLLKQKDVRIDSLYGDVDESVKKIKQATVNVNISAKIIDNTDRRLSRSIAALQPHPFKFEVDVIDPILPAYSPLPLPQVSYEKEKENIFKRVFNWFR